MMNYTPGPWTVRHFVDPAEPNYEPTEQGLYEIEEANDEINGWLKDGEPLRAQEVAEANRRAIEAVPDMLLALAWISLHPDTPAPDMVGRVLLLVKDGRCNARDDCDNPADPKLEGWCDNCAEDAWVSHYSDLNAVSADERHEQAWKQKEELR